MKSIVSFDGTFVSYMLDIAFGKSILMASSANGGASHYNQKSHNALDETKLKFVKGKPIS